MKNVPNLSRLMVLALVLSAGCNTVGEDPLFVEGILFPLQKTVEGQRDVMQALLIGTLRESEGCLTVVGAEAGSTHVPIWPPGYTLEKHKGIRWVVDDQGRRAAPLGVAVRMGGGEFPEEALAQVLAPAFQDTLPSRCPGPYWLVGDGVQPQP